jgi:NAD(P)-dependent dehydrogenase (short-subunit alcohol dehydrogenase family)
MYLHRFSLERRVAVITGGAQGIGLACAEALAEAGAKIFITDSNADAGAAAADTLRSRGYESTFELVDVTKPEQISSLPGKVLDRYGGIDILVNSAGIARSGTPAEQVDDELWRNVLSVNLDGTFWCCREFGRLMIGQRSGSIVNIGSMSGFIVNRPQPQAYYNASKAAVHHLTKSLAAEWGDRGVRVNAVAPTYIDTPLNSFASSTMMNSWIENTPMRRIGNAKEIASVVLFLASDAASLLTGSIIVADGGYSCW